MGRHGAVTFKGNPLTLAGEEIKVGSAAPAFDLASFGPNGMQHITNADVAGAAESLFVPTGARGAAVEAAAAASARRRKNSSPMLIVIIFAALERSNTRQVCIAAP